MKPQKLQPKNGQLSIPANYFEQLHDWIDDLEKRLDQQSLRRQPDIAFRGSAISSGSGGSADYSGAFKIAQTVDGSGYRVIDGRQPDSLYCGKCLISSSVYDVSSAVVAWTAGTVTEVYVVWVGSGRGAIISTTDNPAVPSMKIGIIQADGTILQLYQGSDMVIPGWVYLVTT